MATIYGDYSRDKIGWFFGLSGWQLATLATTVMPVFWAIQHGAWLSAVLFAGLWVLVFVVTVAPCPGPVRDRVAGGLDRVRHRRTRRVDTVSQQGLNRQVRRPSPG